MLRSSSCWKEEVYLQGIGFYGKYGITRFQGLSSTNTVAITLYRKFSIPSILALANRIVCCFQLRHLD